MSGSLDEVRVVLAGAAEEIGSAHGHARLAHARITEAVTVLTGLGEQHSEPLVPDELHRATEKLERVLGLISGGAAVVADIDARL